MVFFSLDWGITDLSLIIDSQIFSLNCLSCVLPHLGGAREVGENRVFFWWTKCLTVIGKLGLLVTPDLGILVESFSVSPLKGCLVVVLIDFTLIKITSLRTLLIVRL